MSILFFVVVLCIVLIAACCRDRIDKCKERIQTLKRKVKYNPLIRYLLLNSLKFNYSAMCVLFVKHDEADIWSKLSASLMLLFINACPILLMYVLRKHDKEL